MNSDQLREVIQDILTDLPYPYQNGDTLYSQDAEELVLSTLLFESKGGEYIRNGSADGLIRLNQSEIDEIFEWLHVQADDSLDFNHLLQKIYGRYITKLPPSSNELRWNLAMNVILCFLKYFKQPYPLPPANDPDSIARFYTFRWDRGPDPKQTIQEFKQKCEKYLRT